MVILKSCLFPFLALISLSSCAHRAQVTPDSVIATAQAYHQHAWYPTDANVKHGRDSQGILVHTPDVTLQKPVASRPGYWKPHQKNVGVPYQWGGFDSLASFDRKIAKGYFAGDVYTAEKRRVLEDGVSQEAAGVDCSGFVSRCWQLPRAYSTRELGSISQKLGSYDELQPGDILNRFNDHVLLFWKFSNAEKTSFYAYEVGSPPSWAVTLNHISVDYLKSKGYEPMRYLKMASPRVKASPGP